MFIRSERLFLRPAWPEDWEEILPLVAQEEIVRNLATVPWPYVAEDAREFAARPQDRRFPHFLVTLPSANGAGVIGSVGLTPFDGEAELGYWIARNHWGRGYATEAVRALTPAARMLGHRRIIASHFVDNPASGRVLLKTGFHRTGDARQRFSQGRGTITPAFGYAIELGDSGTCGGNDDDARPARMAA